MVTDNGTERVAGEAPERSPKVAGERPRLAARGEVAEVRYVFFDTIVFRAETWCAGGD